MTDQHHDHEHDHGHSHDHGGGGAHDHDHGHSHDHGDPFHPQLGAPLDTSELDPANRSLAEALRLSFGILKVVMVVLVALFLLSGIFKVNENEVVLRQRFGRLIPTPLEAGTYLSWPRPIDQAIRVPTSTYQAQLDDSFWVSLRPDDRNKTLDQLSAKNQLQPGEDGSLITGDRNIVHGKWTVNYRIDKANAADFVRNTSASTDRLEMENAAGRRVKQAAERAVVHVIATVPAESIIRGSDVSGQLRQQTQINLDELHSGITVGDVLTVQVIPPLSVRGEFELVAQARSRRDAAIEVARQEQEKLLTETAGGAHPALTLAIDFYESAKARGDDKAAELGEKVIDDLLEGTAADKALAPLKGAKGIDEPRFTQASVDKTAAGEVSKLIQDARSYKNSAYQIVRAEADQFERLYPLYKQNPQSYLALNWEALRADVFRSKLQIWSINADQKTDLWLDLNTDPRWTKARETEEGKAAVEAEKAAKQKALMGR